MRLKILGAAGEVTGSNYLLETDKHRVLVDCGMHQGRDDDRRNMEPFPFDPRSIDAVILTHAHIDHSGRIPLLVKQGFKGKIWMTTPTMELCALLWRDSARLMAEEAEWKSRKNSRRNLPPVLPLYTDRDVEIALERIEHVPYDQVSQILPTFSARYRDAGHIMGSAIVEVWLEQPERTKVVFSGDLGPMRSVLEKSPSVVEDADFVLIESTYGDRLHKTLEDTRSEFQSALSAAIAARSKILVPTFVVDRAQRVLFELLLLQESKQFEKTPPIYFDSPMGTKTTGIYRKHMSLLSQEVQGWMHKDQDPFQPEGLHYVSSVEESRAINEIIPAIVLAGSGMCNGGRIVHHLKHNLWRENCDVFFVGYQAKGTLGRRLIDGEKELKIAGEEVIVRAKFHTLNGFSAHGDRRDLLQWASHFQKNAMFIVTHGEPSSSQALALGLRDLGYNVQVPVPGSEYNLLERNSCSTCSLPPLAIGQLEKEKYLQLLSEITTAAVSLKESSIPEIGSYASLLPLLESSRLLLKTAAELKK